jgi:hypothetical protein
VGPSKAWFWLAGAIGLLGIALGTFLVVAAVVGYFDRIDDFQRVPVPGSGEVLLEDDGGYTVYFEAPFIPDADDPDVEVRIEPVGGGAPLRLRDYGSSVSYSQGDVDGTAMQSFRVEEPGTYEVTATGEPGRVAIGRGLGSAIRPGLVGAAVIVAAIIVAATLALLVGLRRISAKRRFPPPPYQPPAVS